MIPVESAILEKISQNLDGIHQQMQLAAQKRVSTEPVTLVAVTKYARPEWMAALYQLGIRDFGESRPQQLKERAHVFAEQVGPGIRWHLIGQLQRNKVRQIIDVAHCIHSVDSFRLLEQISHVSQTENVCPELLLQINIAGEAQKSGFEPAELLSQADRFHEYVKLPISGWMTMAPDTEEEAVLRRTFTGLVEFAASFQRCFASPVVGKHYSMGMSGDFPIAIEQGATLIRVGSRLFAGLK